MCEIIKAPDGYEFLNGRILELERIDNKYYWYGHTRLELTSSNVREKNKTSGTHIKDIHLGQK